MMLLMMVVMILMMTMVINISRVARNAPHPVGHVNLAGEHQCAAQHATYFNRRIVMMMMMMPNNEEYVLSKLLTLKNMLIVDLAGLQNILLSYL